MDDSWERRKFIGKLRKEIITGEAANGLQQIGSMTLVVLGEVNVVPEGADPNGMGYLSRASTTLSLLRIDRGDTVSSPAYSITVSAPTKSGSIHRAMIISLERGVSNLVDMIQVQQEKMKLNGKRYEIWVRNISNNLRQLRPIERELENIGELVSKRTVDEENNPNRAVRITIQGNWKSIYTLQNELEKAIKPLIDDSLIDDLSVDGEVIEIKLR